MNNSNFAAIAVNKSICKEYNTSESSRTVYLNDGDEFQFQLFNSETTKIGVEISINGDVMSGLLVVRPGERIWLERYLDTAKKFKFSTYEVEDGNSQVDRAISNNGDIQIRFYKEKNRCDNHILYLATPIGTTIATTQYNADVSLSSAKVCDTMLLGSSEYSIGSLTNEISWDTANQSKSFTEAATSVSTKETGRVEQGSYSNQKLTCVDTDFETWAFRTENIKILPMSRKPYTAADAQKLYCTNCGKKLNPKYKFCPSCGTKVE